MGAARPALSGRVLLLLLGYLLLLPKAFVLAPLVGLLLASGPRTLREWSWIAVGGLWLVVSSPVQDNPDAAFLGAWALFVTGAFVWLSLAGRRPLAVSASVAVAVALVGMTAWLWNTGTTWQAVQLTIARARWAQFHETIRTLERMVDQQAVSEEFLTSMSAGFEGLSQAVVGFAPLLPGLLILAILPGLALAWLLYHSVAAEPWGVPTRPFAEFRFSDHLVWCVVLLVAAMMLPLPPALDLVAGNVAIVAGGLYAARGAAVVWSAINDFPAPILALMAVGSLIVLPVELGGFFALGLADTWVDFRRRFSAGS